MESGLQRRAWKCSRYSKQLKFYQSFLKLEDHLIGDTKS
jgi:hypothetical protein